MRHPIPIKSDSPWRGTADCVNCGIRDMVLFADLSKQELEAIHAPIDDLAFRFGESLYHEAQEASRIYTLRSGMIKLQRFTPDGRQRILRILRPGDVVGLEVLATQRYDSEAVALTDVTVCRIPVEVVMRLAQKNPKLHLRLLQKWQRALKEADDWLAELNFGTARQRVGQFVLKMRDPQDLSVTHLFSREEMGAMMDLKLETVSREISALVREGALAPLDKAGRTYRVLEEGLLQPELAV